MKKSLLFLLTFFLGRLAFAQQGEILYQEFEPAIQRSYVLYWPQEEDIIHLDFDQDGNNDWYTEQVIDDRWQEFMYVRFWYPVTISMAYYVSTKYIEFGDTLTNVNWNNFIEFYGTELYHNEDHWVGFRWRRDNGYCYGWMEVGLQCDNYMGTGFPRNIEFSIYRLAYCTQPDYPLRVGQTCFNWDAVDDSKNLSFASIQPNPNNGHFTVVGQNLKSAVIYNAIGQKVASTQGEGNQLTLDLSAQPAGIYFVNITDSEGRKCVRKVLKK